VDNVAFVEVFGALEELDEDLAGFLFGELLLCDDEVEEFSFCCELQYQVDAIVFVEGVFEAEHIRVTDTHEDGDLLLETLGLGALRLAHALFKFLDSEFEACRALDTEIDRGKVTLTKLLQNSIL
jgi:hypothetical protein